ncbi:type VII secretion integral membrane protein EccD [Nonomuraea spiralis]|uniref:Type VII secretion integral membrane protein EccD n=1 Tax=Nonomuraea spiralis TaxID=46182 RepID=A0ABV5IA71_9ACTN|nr:type VII secretion integral membrane protein EccD [Nonomuraea spiralis]GGT04831.1 type VII secretion integral membrane protein EccD [Nonomuraea spiralis]
MVQKPPPPESRPAAEDPGGPPAPTPSGPVQQGALAQLPLPLPVLCNVTIVGPGRKADLTLPADIPLPHVLPGLLRMLGEVGGDATSSPGWTLQRLGGSPLDLEQSLSALGVLDAEILYLRPRESILPAAIFDDVADVVATGVREGPGKWTAAHTAALGAAGATGLLVLGAVGLALAGLPPLVGTVVFGTLALLLIAAGTVLSRAMGDSTASALIGHAALPYAFLAGLFTPAGSGGPAGTGGLAGIGAPHLLAAFACTALAAAVAGMTISHGIPGFLGTAIAATCGAVCAAVVMLTGTVPAGVAAVAIAVLLALSPLVPTLSFRLARVPLPAMPTTAEELRADNQRLDAAAIQERTVIAQRYATAQIVAVGLAALVAQALLVLHDGLIAYIMTVALSLTLIMRARVFSGVGQRLWLVGPGMAGLAMTAFALSSKGGVIGALAVAVCVLWASLLMVGVGRGLATGKPSPFWGRAGDILDLLLIVELFPLAAGVLELYTWVRGLSG